MGDESIDLAALVLRWMHLLAAGITLGGTCFSRLALTPAREVLGEAERTKLDEAVRARWMVPVMISIAFLLVSGLYNIAQTSMTQELPRWYHYVFVVKFLAALGAFYIASTLVGRSSNAQRFRQNSRFWLNLNVALLVTVVLLSGVLRAAPRHPKTKSQPAAAATEAAGAGEAAK